MSNLRIKIWFSLFVLVVFLVGLGTGIVVTPWLGDGPRTGSLFGPADPRPPGGPPRPPGGPPPMSERLMDRLASSIDLTDEQTTSLEVLFDTRRERFREISREIRELFDRERDTFRTALSEILTVDQMDQFSSEIVKMGLMIGDVHSIDGWDGLAVVLRQNPGELAYVKAVRPLTRG